MNQVSTVILAAGQSQRMGQAKLLLPWGETTILGQTITQVQASQASQALLVSGAYRLEVEAIAQTYQLPVVYNPHYATGEMLSSLQCGVRQLLTRPEPPAAVLVMLGDLPFIRPETINQVMNAFYEGCGQMIVPTFQGQRGHPVLIGQSLWPALLELPAGSAPRDLGRVSPIYWLELPDETIVQDLDTPEQYHRQRSKKSAEF
jgi:molybdenum cofactor cytidylyltransferase